MINQQFKILSAAEEEATISEGVNIEVSYSEEQEPERFNEDDETKATTSYQLHI